MASPSGVVDRRPYLELGPECNYHTSHRSRHSKRWLTMGMSDKTRSDIRADLDADWPLASEMFDIIYASHVIEHCIDSEHFLSECLRLLRPGGLLRLSVPDPQAIMQQYLSRKIDLDNCLVQLRSHVIGQHSDAFDKPKLIRLLSQSGFIMVTFPNMGKSMHAEMNKNKYFHNRMSRSIIVEGKKPCKEENTLRNCSEMK